MKSSQYCFFPSTQVPYLHEGSPTENYVSLWISGKSTVWLRMTTLTLFIQLALRQMHHNTWQGSHYSTSFTTPELITACRWRTNVLWKCLHSILLAEALPTRDLHKVSAYLCLLFQASCASTWTQLTSYHCAQYLEDNGIPAKNATELTVNRRAVFICIRPAGLKLTHLRCHFGVKQVEFLGRTMPAGGISPQSHKVQNFLSKLRFPKSKKASQQYLDFVNYYRKWVLMRW